jgi:hypothetical protein
MTRQATLTEIIFFKTTRGVSACAARGGIPILKPSLALKSPQAMAVYLAASGRKVTSLSILSKKQIRQDLQDIPDES